MHKTILTLVSLGGAAGLLFAVGAPSGDSELAGRLKRDPAPPARSGENGGYADVVEKVSPSIVSIFTEREAAVPRYYPWGLPFGPDTPGPRGLQKERGLGSGVVLTGDGYILTNNHVIDRADTIKVRLSNGTELEGDVVATDPASDLAVVKVEGEGLPAATIGDSSVLKPGDFVLAIGSPFGLNTTVTSGIVSALGRDNLNIVGYEDFIQTDASINPGNSGGALIDNGGRVVGINTAILSRTGGNVGIGFAIPINMAVEIADELIANGGIDRGYLGVTMGEIDARLAAALGVAEEGVVINDVIQGTPAAKAGFKPGDVVVEAGGAPVDDMADLRRRIGRAKPDTELLFSVRRGDRTLELKATLEAVPADLVSGTKPRKPDVDPDEGSLAGVRLAALDDFTRDRLGLEPGTDGVVVVGVVPRSKAAEAGLKRGDVITQVNRKEVRTQREAYAAAAETEHDATLLRVLGPGRSRFIAIG